MSEISVVSAEEIPIPTKAKPKRVMTEKQLEHLATIRIKAREKKIELSDISKREKEAKTIQLQQKLEKLKLMEEEIQKNKAIVTPPKAKVKSKKVVVESSSSEDESESSESSETASETASESESSEESEPEIVQKRKTSVKSAISKKQSVPRKQTIKRLVKSQTQDELEAKFLRKLHQDSFRSLFPYAPQIY